MAGNQVTGDGLSTNLVGMSKNQLYDIMSQMKLIEQNQDQGRQISIQNPLLQAMKGPAKLGMKLEWMEAAVKVIISPMPGFRYVLGVEKDASQRQIQKVFHNLPTRGGERIYSRVLKEEYDPSSPIGSGWKATFTTNNRSEAEERAAKLGLKLEWMETFVMVIIGPMPGFKYDKARQRKIWFNDVVASYGRGLKDELNDDPAKAVMFGGGKPLPANVNHDCSKIFDEKCVELQWRKGDVMLVDNLAIIHSQYQRFV